MPELPEVETIRRGLEPVVAGRTFSRVEILDERLTRPVPPSAVAGRLTGEVVERLDRRGKYLIFRFEGGASLLVHLRMTGSFAVLAPGELVAHDPHRRAVVILDNDSDVLVYRDVRRFGTWTLAGDEEAREAYIAQRLGAEPFAEAFTAEALAAALATRRAPIKSALLDQRTLAGLGNIYVDEALWRAEIHPLAAARDLDVEALTRLREAIRTTLEAGIARQGATLRDYRTADGGRGSMQEEFNVYGREGLACPRCGGEIMKTRAAGRGTWYCPTCQSDGGAGAPAPDARQATRQRASPGQAATSGQAASRSSRPRRSRRQSSS